MAKTNYASMGLSAFGSIQLAILMIVFTFVGFWGTFKGLDGLKKNYENTWVQVSAYVVKADDISKMRCRQKLVTSRCVNKPRTNIKYEYKVDGKTYVGTATLDKTVTLGETLQIEYDPINVDVSRKVLTSNVMSGIYIVVGIISFMLLYVSYKCITNPSCRETFGIFSIFDSLLNSF
jgi:hypothetical protein